MTVICTSLYVLENSFKIEKRTSAHEKHTHAGSTCRYKNTYRCTLKRSFFLCSLGNEVPNVASNRSVCGNEDRCIMDWGPHYFSPESLSFVRITSRCVWQCDRLRPVACMRTHSCTCGHFTALVFFRCQSCEGLRMVILNTPNEQSQYTHHFEWHMYCQVSRLGWVACYMLQLQCNIHTL